MFTWFPYLFYFRFPVARSLLGFRSKFMHFLNKDRELSFLKLFFILSPCYCYCCYLFLLLILPAKFLFTKFRHCYSQYFDRKVGKLCSFKRQLNGSCYVLIFNPAPQKMLFQGDAPEGSDTFQWPVIERDRVGGLRLIIWDMVKVPLCQTDWCTGREWPPNCMTVISAWWRLNIRFQRSGGRSCGRWIII